MNTPITVLKKAHDGHIKLQYEGVLRASGPTWVYLEARFGSPDITTEYVTFRQGDTLYEWFYSDRYYNIFELYDRDDARLKGWYCNVVRPAVFTYADAVVRTVAADDLELDVFVQPSGKFFVLDEDEFAALTLPPGEYAASLAAVDTLRSMVAAREAPFDKIS